MIPRLFLGLFTALAMLVAPFAMAGAMASAPASHHGEAMKGGHCGDQDQQSDPKGIDMPCCVGACFGFAPLADGDLSSTIPFGEIPPAAERERAPHSFLAELPTPPPRSA